MTTPGTLFAPIATPDSRKVQRLAKRIEKATKPRPRLRARRPVVDDGVPSASGVFGIPESGFGGSVDVLRALGGGLAEFGRTAFERTFGGKPEPGTPTVGPFSLRSTREVRGEPLNLPGPRGGRQVGEAVPSPL